MVYQVVDFLSRLAKARPFVLGGHGEAALQAFFPNRLPVDWDLRAWPPPLPEPLSRWIDTVMRRREQLGEPLRRTLVSMAEELAAEAPLELTLWRTREAPAAGEAAREAEKARAAERERQRRQAAAAAAAAAKKKRDDVGAGFARRLAALAAAKDWRAGAALPRPRAPRPRAPCAQTGRRARRARFTTVSVSATTTA